MVYLKRTDVQVPPLMAPVMRLLGPMQDASPPDRMWSSLPARNFTPSRPVPSPSMSSPSRMTLAVSGAEMMMAFVPDTSTPASKRSERIVIDFVMVTPPKPPGSSTLISPPVAVFEIAPANVLHGAVRLHGLTSSPTPETHVRVACALAKSTYTRESSSVAHMIDSTMALRITENLRLTGCRARTVHRQRTAAFYSRCPRKASV